MIIKTENGSVQLSREKEEFLHFMDEHPELLEPMVAMLTDFITAKKEMDLPDDEPATELLLKFWQAYEPFMIKAINAAKRER